MSARPLRGVLVTGVLATLAATTFTTLTARRPGRCSANADASGVRPGIGVSARSGRSAVGCWRHVASTSPRPDARNVHVHVDPIGAAAYGDRGGCAADGGRRARRMRR